MGQLARKRKTQASRGKVANKPRTRAKGTKKTEAPEETGGRIFRESAAIFFLFTAVFLGLAVYSYYSVSSQLQSLATLEPSYYLASSKNIMGPLGYWSAAALVSLLGWCSIVAVLGCLLLARAIWVGETPQSFRKFSLIGLSALLMVAACSVIATVLVGEFGGGLLGNSIAQGLAFYVNDAGAMLVAIAALTLSLRMVVVRGRVSSSTFGLFKRAGSFIAEILLGCLVLFNSCCRLTYRILKSIWSVILRVLGMVYSATRSSFLAICTAFRWLREKVAPDAETSLGQNSSGLEQSWRIESAGRVKAPSPSVNDAPRPVLKRPNLERHSVSNKKRQVHSLKAKGRAEKEQFKLPPSSLLVAAETRADSSPEEEELIENCRKLEKALANFRIGGRVVEVQAGPVITLYQFEPAAGIKVQRIVNLSDDLALSLRVGSVRVYAPVPGKGTVGIEVPNSKRDIVLLRDVVESERFHDSDHPLTLALAKDTFGESVVADLAKMPHLLIAGATGTGKSVCINSILLSLLFRNTPDQLQLILIDPKMLELSTYEDIPHLKAPVVTQPKRSRGVLWWAVEEMERRYRLMKDLGVRNLASYNKLVAPEVAESEEEVKEAEVSDGFVSDPIEVPESSVTQSKMPGMEQDLEPLPRIVIVVDELADLMLTVGREIEELLTRLAQKARAAGIHLILATQRPSVNVITGLIKANFPARISFQVASRIDARTILDGSGAEKLLGQGDMLFLAAGTGRVRRLHSPFVSDEEVAEVVSWWRGQGAPRYDEAIEEMIEKLSDGERGSSGAGFDTDEYDPLYDQAVQLVVEKGQASTSMVQRVFRIGYNRAARILETMEREGVVGPADGAKPRQILAPNNIQAD